jgi:small subunit ribosomal protein S4e
MGGIAGSKKLKRQTAPSFWGIERKNKRFVITVRPGPHGKDRSIPTAVLLRDTIKKVSTLREAKATIYNGKVNVDGITRKSLHHSIGLMDVIEFKDSPDIYRLVPQNKQVLIPIIINSDEKSKKIVKIISKTTIKSGKMQLGFHDGRTLITDIDVNVDDSCLLQIPDQKILNLLKLENGCIVIVTRGVNAGHIGYVDKIKEGTFSLPKRIDLVIDDKKIEIPVELVMVIGKEKPVIKVR